MKRLISIILWLLVTCNIPSYGYYYKQYTTSNLLISNRVYHSLHDHKGYMWFFTNKGVSKFNGENFKNFSVVNGLSDNDIYHGYQDRSGRLWLFTSNGQPCYIRNDTAYNEKKDKLLKKLPIISYIEYIYEDIDSSLYIGYKEGSVYKLHDTTCTLILGQNYDEKVSFIWKENNIFKIFSEHKITSLVNNIVADKILTDKTNSFHDFKYRLSSDKDGIKIHISDSLIWDYRDTLLNFYHNVIHIYYDGKENVFCATKNGLIIINTKTHKKNTLFSHQEISCTAQDIYGNFWITTARNGIYYLDKNLDKIKSLPDVAGFNLIEATNHQIFFIKNNSIFHYKENDSSILEKINFQFKDDFIPVYVDNKYFFYAHKTVGYCLNRNNDKLIQISNFKNIFKISENKYILIRWADLNIATISDTISLSPPISIGSDGYGIYDHNNSNIYCYHNNKVFSYDMTSFSYSPIDSLNRDQSIAKSYLLNDKFIVITNDQNLTTYDIRKKNRKQVIPNLPFSCFGISTINASAGTVKYILNTSKGYYLVDDLYNITNGAKKIEYPIKQSDLLDLYVFANNVICNLSGDFYIFENSLLNREIEQPVFYIENVAVNGKTRSDSVIIIKNSLHTHVAVSLSSLKFNNIPSHYAYRLISSNSTGTWNNSSSDNLDILIEKYNDYQIEIKSITDNNLSTPSKFINLKILPPFYLTYEFYMLVFFLLIIATILIVMAYHKHRQNLFQNELNYLQLEHRSINSLINPHFIFNAINNIQNLINIGSKETANNYLAILSRLIRQNIENLQFSFIPVSKELSLIKNYIHLQNLRFDNRITLKIDNSIANSDEVNIPPLLIHTFVENSVVHGFRKELDGFTITVDLSISTDHYLIIRITDNGVGLTEIKTNTPATEKLSLGIEFIRKRLKRISDFYKVTFSIEINNLNNSDQTGTEVVIVLYSRFMNQ